jgi:hypothetical protein
MFEPENALEKLLVQAVKNPEARAQFYRDLLEADIYALSADQSATGTLSQVLTQGTEVHFQHFDIQGIRYLPIFTSRNRIQALVKSPSSYLKFKGRSFFELTRGEKVFLNPGSEIAKGFTPREISDLLDGSIFQPRPRFKIDEATEIYVGQAAEYPAELIKNLLELFSHELLVRTAYLAVAASPAAPDKPHFLVGIDVEGDWKRILVDVKKAARQGDAANTAVKFVQIDESPLGRYMTTQTEAFYQRDPDPSRGVGL